MYLTRLGALRAYVLYHAPYLRALRTLSVRVKIVLGWICSPAKIFHFPWIFKGTTTCVVLNKSLNRN